MIDPGDVILRCHSQIAAVLKADKTLEVKCTSRQCGAGKGVAVFHYWDLITGEIIATKQYKDPSAKFEGKRGSDTNGGHHRASAGTAVRHP